MSVNENTKSGRWPPKRCEMPDLSNLPSNLTSTYLLNQELGRTGLRMQRPGQYFFLNLVRLVDKTVLEYEQARQYLQRYVDSHNKSSLLFRATGYMENCVDTLNRVFRHLRRLRTSLYKEQSSTSEIMPKVHRSEIPNSSEVKRVNCIRDAIQHMDDSITKGEAGEGIGSIGLMVKSDSIEIKDHEVYFAELAAWIEQVYRVTEQLANYAPSQSNQNGCSE